MFKKFWQLVSKKDLIFGALLILVVVIITFVEINNKITVTFEDAAVTIQSSKYSMKVDYDLISSAELVEMPDEGEVVDGFDDMSIRTGNWHNAAWGDYVVCAVPQATNCVVMHLTDGRTFVFNCKSNEETAAIYETLTAHIASTVPAVP